MNDPLPVQNNRVAVFIGRVLNPFSLPIPTLLIILNDLPFRDLLPWFALTIGLILVPGVIATRLTERYISPIYMRRTRGPLYLIAWISVIVCLAVFLRLNAPRILIAAVATLTVWVPLQWAINTWVTKISAHAAVAAGCLTTLFILDKAGTPLVTGVLLVLMVLMIWARVITRHHTLPQVILGVLVGALPVLIVFPLAIS